MNVTFGGRGPLDPWTDLKRLLRVNCIDPPERGKRVGQSPEERQPPVGPPPEQPPEAPPPQRPDRTPATPIDYYLYVIDPKSQHWRRAFFDILDARKLLKEKALFCCLPKDRKGHYSREQSAAYERVLRLLNEGQIEYFTSLTAMADWVNAKSGS